jgi:hypothetical protein
VRATFKSEMALLLHKATRKTYTGMKSWCVAFV